MMAAALRAAWSVSSTGILLLALACIHPAWAQRTPVFQSGVLVAPNNLAKFTSNGLIVDAQVGVAGSGLFGDINGWGVNSFAITDKLGLGLCSNSGRTNAAYWALCLGHDASGNALITSDAYGGAAEKSFFFRKNGSLYEFPFVLSGIVGPTPTIAGNAAVWNNTVGTLLRDEGAPPGLAVATNAALKLTPGITGRRVVRAGFLAVGDGGGNVPYTWSASNCTAADDGKQVQPSATGCWIADFAGLKPTPKMWGAVGDGVANDRTALQAAITAMAGNTLYLGPYKYKINTGISCSSPMRVVGEGRSATGQHYSAIIAGAVNLNLFETCEQSYFGNFYIDAGAAGVSASGWALGTTNNSGNSIFDAIWIQSPCVGIDLNGGSQTILNVRIENTRGTGCGGIQVGRLTTGGTTVDARILNVGINSDLSNRADYAVRIKDAGGLMMVNHGFLFTKVGVEIFPGAGQHVEWSFFNNGALGDATQYQGLTIDTAHATAMIRGLVFNSTWTATSAASHGVEILNSAGAANYTGVSFIGHRSYNNFATGVSVSAASNRVSFDAVRICGNAQGTPANGLNIGPNAGLVSVRNSTIADNCDGFPVNVNHEYAIALLGNNAGTMITNNELSGAILPVQGIPTSASVVANNINIDTIIRTLASATAITLDTIHPTWKISGTTPVETINGAWDGRAVRLMSSTGAVPYATGGNICNAITTASLGMVTAIWDSACWRLQ